MKTKQIFPLAILLLLLLLPAPRALAADPIGTPPGLSGRLGLGAMYDVARTNTASAAALGIVPLGAPLLQSLNAEPMAHKGALPIVALNVQYGFSGTGTELFGGLWNHGDTLRFDSFNQGGVRQDFGSAGKLSLSYLYGLAVRVWADPYVTGVKRDQVMRHSQGGRLAWENIFGTGLQAQYVFRQLSYNDERSGEFLGVSPENRELLRRDGYVHMGEISNTVKLLRGGLKFTPSITYTRDALQGDAMSAHSCDFKLRTMFATRILVTIVEGSIGRSVHDEPNPVFRRTQSDLRYAVSLTETYRTPFGWKPWGHDRWNLFATVRYNAAVSNIDFFSASFFGAGGGVGVEF